MEDLIASMVIGIIEMTLVILAAIMLAPLWCLAVVLLTAGRFGVSVIRNGLDRRRTRRELARIFTEYEIARRDIRRMADATTRQILAIAKRQP
jgi:hypothetical protein